MLVREIMTKNVITVRKDTPVIEALKIMKEHNFRRLPVVDEKDRPIGLVTERRLETITPSAGTPLLWQINYLVAHTTVGEVMRKEIVTVNPEDSVEYAIAKAQTAKVGTVIVVERSKIAGICTTNDFFYAIVNPTLGIGEPGSRIIISNGGDSKSAEKILSIVNKKALNTRVIWSIYSHEEQGFNLVLHLDIDDPSELIQEIGKAGFESKLVQR